MNEGLPPPPLPCEGETRRRIPDRGATLTATLDRPVVTDDVVVEPTRRPRPSWALILVIVVTVVAAALRLYRLRYGYAHAVVGYDDGVYLGSALHLVEGDLPYRDYTLVHPPAITLLLTPVALLAKIIGTAQAMGIAKLLTAAVGTASAPLTARLLWHRGPATALLAAAVVALHDDAVASAYGLLLEPWLVFLCLVGAVLVFDGDRVAGDRRLWWGGVIFGIACATKIWAFAPVVAVALVCLPSARRTARYLLGVAVGFLVPVLPFALAAPGAFWHQVFGVQLFRSTGERTSTVYRLLHLFSVGPPNGDLPARALGWLIAVAVVVAAAMAVVSLVVVRRSSPLERFSVLGAVSVTAMLFVPGTFYWHYATFAVPFLATAAVVPLGRFRRPGRRVWTAVLVGCVVGLACTMVVRDLRSYHLDDDHVAFDRVVPAGSCVVTTMSSVTIANDRFAAGVPGCPDLLDSFGAALDHADGAAPTDRSLRDPGVVRLWRSALTHADFVLLVRRDTPTFPRDPAVVDYLHSHFRLVADPGIYGTLYERVR